MRRCAALRCPVGALGVALFGTGLQRAAGRRLPLHAFTHAPSSRACRWPAWWPCLTRTRSSPCLLFFRPRLPQVMQLATYLTYFAPQISPRMWSLFPRMLQVQRPRAAPALHGPPARRRLREMSWLHGTAYVPAPEPALRALIRHLPALLSHPPCALSPPQCINEWAIDYFEEVGCRSSSLG